MAEESRESTLDEVKEHPLNGETKSETVADSVSHPESKVDDTETTQADEPLKNGDSTRAKSASSKVLEGHKWNNRNRDRRDFKKNVKSDLTSQEESSDPAAIRKQVREAALNCRSAKYQWSGRVLLFQLQSASRQISLFQG